jgi:hypothetical protein
MTKQEIIDKHIKQFHEVQRLKVPIELNIYLHRIIEEALRIHDDVGQSEQVVCDVCESTDDVQSYCVKCMNERC